MDLGTFVYNENLKGNLHHFVEPSPAREVSIIYHKSELKMQIIDALHNVISGIIRGAIAFQNVKIISPLRLIYPQYHQCLRRRREI